MMTAEYDWACAGSDVGDGGAELGGRCRGSSWETFQMRFEVITLDKDGSDCER